MDCACSLPSGPLSLSLSVHHLTCQFSRCAESWLRMIGLLLTGNFASNHTVGTVLTCLVREQSLSCCAIPFIVYDVLLEEREEMV